MTVENEYDLIKRLPTDLLVNMSGCRQNPIYHPEGDALTHTMIVVENVIKLYAKDPDFRELLIAAIFHDVGKPETIKIVKLEDGSEKISHIDHEVKSMEYVDKLFYLYSDITTDEDMVMGIVEYHMRAKLYEDKLLKKKSKRLAFESLPYFEQVMKFTKCDKSYLV